MAGQAGQIIKRGESTWLLRVFLERDPLTGTRRYHNQTFHGTKKAAQTELAKLITSRSNGTLSVETKGLLIGALLDDVVRDYRVNGQDVGWCETVVENLRPMFGKLPVSSIRPKHIDAYTDKRLDQGRKPATIENERAILRRAFNLAVEKGTLAVVPFKIPKLKLDNTRAGFMEYDEFIRFRAALPSELKPVLICAYYTGLRRAEILKMKWSQVDLAVRIVRLDVGTTKNKKGRILPLQVGELYETIAMLKAEREERFPECPWVFTRDGKPIKEFRAAWDNACKAAGQWDAVTDRHTRIFHDLRRTGVRNLVRAGVPEKIAMLISGHKTRSVFDRYNVCDERDLIEGMARLDRYSRARDEAEKNAEKSAPGNWHTIGTHSEERPN
jgi:integrase